MSKLLRIAILARTESATVTDELAPVIRARGHTLDIIDLASVTLSMLADDPAIHALTSYDVVYYRTCGVYPTVPALLPEIMRQSGIPLLNGIQDIHAFFDRKTYQTALVSTHLNITPKTALDADKDFTRLTRTLGAPFVAKADISSQGRDVHLIHTAEELAALPPLQGDNLYLYQSYIPHSCDYRVHVLGSKAIATYARRPSEGDFRSNVSRGGTMEAVPAELTARVFDIAEKVNALFKLDIAAIDFLLSDDDGKLYFSEINANPGWQGHNRDQTGIDMNEVVADYIEAAAKR